MKTNLALLTIALTLTGCAHFTTTQTDTSYETPGTPSRAITTKASSTTFFDSKSTLSKFRASQTDKSQTASVGGLESESSSEGLVKLMGMAFEMGKKSVVPAAP